MTNKESGEMLAQGDCSGDSFLSCDGEGQYMFCPALAPTGYPTSAPTSSGTAPPSVTPNPSPSPTAGEQLCPHIVMTDAQGDGWGNAEYTWQMEGSDEFETGTMVDANDGGHVQTKELGLNSDGVCDISLEDGACYTLSVSFASEGDDYNAQFENIEVGWTLFGPGTESNPNNLLAVGTAGESHTECWGTPSPTATQAPTRTKSPTSMPSQANVVTVSDFSDFKNYAQNYGTEAYNGPITIIVTEDLELNTIVQIDNTARVTIIGDKNDGTRVKMTPGETNTGALFRISGNAKVKFENIDFVGGAGYASTSGNSESADSTQEQREGGSFYVYEDSFVGFKECSISGGDAVMGGCLFLQDSDLHMINTDVFDCTANAAGGAFYFDGDYAGSGNELLMKNTRLFNNSVGLDENAADGYNTGARGGGAVISAAYLTMTGSEWFNNFATSAGGGFALLKSISNITTSHFHHNLAGAKAQLEEDYSSLAGNHGLGGAGYFSASDCPDFMDGCHTTFRDCIFLDNEAIVNGGALFPTGQTHYSLLGDSLFEGNVAFDEGAMDDVYMQVKIYCPGSSCGPGSYGDCVSIDNTQCYSCQPNVCIGCEAGKYGTKSHMVDDSQCVYATKGFYVPEPGGSIELPCPPGTYAGNAEGFGMASGATQCLECDAGKFASEGEQIECDDCLAGTGSDAGATVCIRCETGKYSQTAGDPCRACEEGKYMADTGAESCDECPTERTTLSVGMLNCESCDAGHYLSDHRVCAMDTLCPEGETCAESDDCLSIR